MGFLGIFLVITPRGVLAETLLEKEGLAEDVKLLRRAMGHLHPGLYRSNTPKGIESSFSDLEAKFSLPRTPCDHRSVSDQDLIREHLRQWAEAAPTLEALRLEEIRTADNRHVLALLEPAFNHAIRTLPPRPTSGMVEMQRLFAKLRR